MIFQHNEINKLYAIITTIQPPTECTSRLSGMVAACAGTLIVAGDKKGPTGYEVERGKGTLQFLDLQAQLDGPFELARKLPTDHYCRKNIAYLHAIAQGATCIYETDDDNAPLPDWQPRGEYLTDARLIPSPFDLSAKNHEQKINNAERWINVYKYFTDDQIWPRGLPLDEIHAPVPQPQNTLPDSSLILQSSTLPLRSPIQQGLVNGSPDVDAIWRLVMDRPFEFADRPSAYLSPGNWCPFNTQSTWWWPLSYPLLYIPSYCSFRMCDIWKSFVAQRCLWEMGYGVAFHAPEVVQERNIHDLMHDFRDEVDGYNRNREFADVLANLDLAPGEQAVKENLRICYEALVEAEFFPKKELKLVDYWLSDLAQISLS